MLLEIVISVIAAFAAVSNISIGDINIHIGTKKEDLKKKSKGDNQKP